MSRILKSAVALALAVSAAGAQAAPTISRLVPPSNPLSATANTLARFLPGQRFDLQVTVQPAAGTTVTSVEYKVDNVTVPGGLITVGGVNAANAGVKTTGLNAGLAAGTAVVSLRAYSNAAPGVHTLTATATASDGSTTISTGNFEVVGYTASGRLAKNIVIMLGDGMGAAHRTAARILSKGYAQGKAQDRLAMDTFPFTGMVMTAALDTIVTDSAPGMANYVNGNKAASGQEGVFPDDTADAFDNPRVEYLSEYLHRIKNKTLGIVTTADVFDATPAANAVHTSNRGNGTGIVDQYFQEQGSTGLTVLMGGGRKWFLPNSTNAIQPVTGVYNNTDTIVRAPSSTLANGSQRRTSTDYVLSADIVAGWGVNSNATMPLNGAVAQNSRDMIAEFTNAGWTYAPDTTGLTAAMTAGALPSKLLGLFSYSNMNVSYDKINGRRCALGASTIGCTTGAAGLPGTGTIVSDYGFPDQPMLDEMTDAALKVLNQNPSGFILMVEGASIDKQAHLMDSDRWMLEVVEFDRAIKKAQDFAVANPDTLVLVTADHECSGAALIGAANATATTLRANAVAAANLPAQVTDGTTSGLPSATAVTRTTLVRDGSSTTATPVGGSAAAPVAGTYQLAKFPKYTILADGFPADMDVDGKLIIGYGANADRYENWLANPQPTQDSQQSFVATGTGNPFPGLPTYPAFVNSRNSSNGFFIQGQVNGDQATHTASDIPLSAFGRGASLFTGVMDNTDVFFKLGQVALGGGK
jgi:alkaline phosphatase